MVDADWITMFGEACKPEAASTGAEFVFVRGEQHVDTGEHRLDNRLLGQSGDISVYRVRP